MFNKAVALVSLLSGAGMLTVAAVLKEATPALSGFGALAVALLAYQMTDLKERMSRLEQRIDDFTLGKHQRHM